MRYHLVPIQIFFMLFSVQQYMYVPSPCPATLVAMRGAVRDHQLAMIITCEDVAMEAQIDLPPPPPES